MVRMQWISQVWRRLCVGVLILAAGTPAAAQVERVPFDTSLADVASLRLSQPGLDFLARLLELGLEQPTLKRDVVNALEGQEFEILVPNFGDQARIVVDFGPETDAPEIDGFRYDDVDVKLSTVPIRGSVSPEPGVLFPQLDLLRFFGEGSTENTDQLPELHVRIFFPSDNFDNPISAVAFGRLSATGVMRPVLRGGSVGFLMEQFDTIIQDFEIDIPLGQASLTPELREALGEAALSGFRKELEDALSDVLQSGINEILFDRDQDGEADELINLETVFSAINEALGTDLTLDLSANFQSNATLPTTVLLRADGRLLQETPGACVGDDVNDGFRFTLLEEDGVSGHDPPTLVDAAPSGDVAQFVGALSDDFLNQVLFNFYRTGLACVFVAPGGDLVPPEVGDLLTTEALAIFTGDWLTDLAPGAPVGFRLRLQRAPFIEIPADPAEQLVVTAPSVQVDVMLRLDGRWVRLMGADARVEVGAALNDLSLEGARVIDASFRFDVTNTLNFVELAPQRRSDLQDLLPSGFSLLEGVAADLLGGFGEGVAECAAGLEIEQFEAGPIGRESQGAFAHYLGLWASVTGQTELAVLLECLLGEPLVQAPVLGAAPQSLPVVPAIGTQAHTAAALAGTEVVRWRFAPGFFRDGDVPVPPLPLGTRTWQWEAVDGSTGKVRLAGAATRPVITTQKGADGRLVVSVDPRAGAVTDDLRMRLTLRDAQGTVLAERTGEIDWALAPALAARAEQVTYTDAWGRRASTALAPQPDVAAGGGCRASPGGAPGVLWPLWLALLWGSLRRRRDAL